LRKITVHSLKIHFSIMLSSSPGFQIFLYSCYFSSENFFSRLYPACYVPRVLI
jgi:hypothetical protein